MMMPRHRSKMSIDDDESVRRVAKTITFYLLFQHPCCLHIAFTQSNNLIVECKGN